MTVALVDSHDKPQKKGRIAIQSHHSDHTTLLSGRMNTAHRSAAKKWIKKLSSTFHDRNIAPGGRNEFDKELIWDRDFPLDVLADAHAQVTSTKYNGTVVNIQSDNWQKRRRSDSRDSERQKRGLRL